MKRINEVENKDEILMRKKRDIEQDLFKIYDHLADGAILRSLFTWYEKGEKVQNTLCHCRKGWQ